MSDPYRLSAHLGYLFTEMPLRDRFRAAKAHGFSAVEHPAPYSVPAREMAGWLEEIGLPYTQFGLRSGEAARGEKGLAIFRARQAEFRDSVMEGLDYAQAIGVSMVHAMAGVLPATERAQDHWDCYVENLTYAADEAARRDMRILVEAMSPGAVPNYFVETPDRAAQAIAATGRDNIRLLFDVFHTVNSGLDLGGEITRHAALIGHVHIADHPGRHEPGTERIDYDAVCRALSSAGYRGFLGCEYTPRAGTVPGLGWMRDFPRRLAA